MRFVSHREYTANIKQINPKRRKTMDVMEAIGSRRSIRFFKPWKPVEEWKIQMMLQAARYASCQGNCGSTEAIVIDKRTYSKEKFERLIKLVEMSLPFVNEIEFVLMMLLVILFYLT